ncbi:hypothetical protein ACFQ5J_09040 [Lacticaseibacillus baoqingensis]|uniref:DUF1642 domain-containing protein n=1 Tax=Lacticaseibacillus baoqingensis TaxID=2486013 RepID=A0ABW4E828_9LACO|nr:hypothetical protein [Lacticaseibacillus baoqingensis]
MSNETKRDVFDAVVNSRWRFLAGNTKGEPTDGECMMAYDAALPDDLPVIPKAVGVSIKEQKAKQSLGGALFDAIFAANELGRKNVGPVVNWMVDNDETYANAWLLGVWRVKETGEIVKLKKEK